MKKIELLSPAGSLEKMKYAIHYGADAVYLGIPDFSLRVRINQFDEKILKEAVIYAHKHKKKIYITLNIYAHNRHLPRVEKHLKILKKLDIDGVIVSDPGILNLVKKNLPRVDIHLSTQANAINWQAVRFWAVQGVKRIILAREVTLPEIKEIKKHNPKVELEYFVHGAMCMSYSGRCILSNWMTNRSANLGDCTQPCRWRYSAKNQISKIKNQNFGIPPRRDDYLYSSFKEELKGYEIDLEEDRHGTYFFNSCDLNLIEYVDELIKAGITSLKIEGRAKSVYYVSVVTRAYRKVIDAMHKKSKKGAIKIVKEQKKELDKLANRGYTTGFLLGRQPEHNYQGETFGKKFQFVGEVLGKEGKYHIIKAHNEINLKDKIEAITSKENIKIKIKKMLDSQKREAKEGHGGHDKLYYFELNKSLGKRTLLRRDV